MDLEIRDLKLVAAVAELGSLTRAGDRLHLTQSALSHQLKELESKLGTAVFLRLNKRMILTTAGEYLLESARHVLSRLEDAEQAVRALAVERRAVLRISTECYTCYHWLPHLLGEFNKKFPHVDVQIDVEATPKPVPSLLEGKLDLALTTSAVRDRRVVVRPLFRDELLVLMRPNHRLASRPYVRLPDFAEETLLLYAPREESFIVKRLLEPAGVTPRLIQRVQLTEAMLEFVKAGLGVAILARWAVQPALASGLVLGKPLGPRGFYRQWHGVVQKHLANLPYVVEFMDLLARSSLPVRLQQSNRLSLTRPHEPRPRSVKLDKLA